MGSEIWPWGDGSSEAMNGSLGVFCKCALSLGKAISGTIDADAAMAELGQGGRSFDVRSSL